MVDRHNRELQLGILDMMLGLTRENAISAEARSMNVGSHML
jgi:hypothetical protein